MGSKKDYTDALLEDINSKFDAVVEAVTGLQEQTKKIPKMAERVEEIEHAVNAIKLDAKFTNTDVRIIKIRTEKLEKIQDDLTDLQTRVKSLEATGTK